MIASVKREVGIGQAVTSAHVNPSGETMPSVAKAVPESERDEAKYRLNALLTYLEKLKGRNRTLLSKDLGVHDSALSAAAVTPGRGVSANLKQKLRHTFGVDDAYWSSPKRLEPAACVMLDVGRVVESGPHAAQARLLALARKRHDSQDVLGSIGGIEPEEIGADPWAWFERYLAILDMMHDRPLKKAR